ncbi:nucleoporin Nup120/160-domain-containing protein [Coniochaeta sp. 2T2.1]|nr:nucleoporin Nup120/160-domain-containing protein [Coniochaeta sp. 2T2.1]
MAPGEVHYVYKETRLNLEPQTASSIVQLRVPSASSSHHSRSGSRITNGASISDDEKTYRTKNLATASSVYRRKHHDSPRSFLWRVLENDTILSIRAADVCIKQKDTTDATLILHLKFGSPLRTSCIGFADGEEHDALTVFVVDHANVLHSITLRPDAFRKRSVTENNFGEACKSYSPPGFGFKYPHRLVAVSPDQFIVTMHDGGILRFDKNKSHEAVNSSPWKETIYNVAGWGQSLRGLVPFQRTPTIRHDKINMELTAATSVAATSMGYDDTNFLFTICLDHRMRVWDVRTGQILYTGDILNANRDPQSVDKWRIDPSQSNLIRIHDKAVGESMVVTYSPVGAGEFKFWKVKGNNQGSVLVADLFPNHKLTPEPPSSLDVWTLADFGIATNDDGPELWTLWKNNFTYKVKALQLYPTSSAGPWNDQWRSVYLDSVPPAAQSSSACDPTDATERWLDLIFYPGRFARSTLETALAMYEKGSGSAKDTSSRGSKTLAESICAVIGSTTTLDQGSAGRMDYDQFRASSEVQWRRFYRLLIELDKQRGEALSLVVDQQYGMPWVLCADIAAAVRQCSSLDRVCHNMNAPEKDAEDVATLVKTGLDFVDNFSDGMLQLCRAALRSEMFEDQAKTDEERLQYFSDKAGFWRQVTEEECNAVVDALGQNFRTVTPSLYEDLFDLLRAESDENNRELQFAFTSVGRSVVVRAAQDTAELHWQILLSQLILLVHMEFEFDNEEDALHARFDVGAIYRKLISALKRLEHIKWMAKTEMNAPALAGGVSRQSSIPGTSSPAGPKRKEEPQVVTVLEGILGHLFGLSEAQVQPLMENITNMVTNLCGLDSDIEIMPHLHQCFLLKADRPDLALQLSPFAPQDAFSTYVQGRVFLALQDYDTAALYFKKAAIGLSISMRSSSRHSSAGLLDDTEWNLLNTGLPKYYSHIVNLYDRQKAYSSVIEFARLALQFTNLHDPGSASLNSEVLSRLFSAATTISHFDVAHSALLAMKDEAMQKSYLRKLVEKMAETGQNRELVSLPFAGLQDKVDEILAEKSRGAVDVVRGVPWHQILYAWRVSRNDYRGAAATLLDRLRKLREAGEGDRFDKEGGEGSGDVMDTAVTRQFLLLINALSCVEEDGGQGFILEDVPDHNQQQQVNGTTTVGGVVEIEKLAAVVGEEDDARLEALSKAIGKSGGRRKETPRQTVTLADLRKEYQEELDRVVAIQNDRYEFGDEDAMDLA